MESNTGIQTIKCKFQFGNASIELEGISSDDDMMRGKIVELVDAFTDSVSEVAIQAIYETQEAESEDEDSADSDANKTGKKSNRGGKRIPWIKKEIDDLCKAGKVANATPEEIMKMIKDKSALAPTKKGVTNALNRRLGIDIIRTEDPPGSSTYRYTYQRPKEEPKKP
jgi:hypothetical protein